MRSLSVEEKSKNNLVWTDRELFLKAGSMTCPFVTNEEINKCIDNICADKKLGTIGIDKIRAIFFVLKNIRHANEKEKTQGKYNRKAEEIWESKFITGSADSALLFATIARQINIPTTIVQTIDAGSLVKIRNGENCEIDGHFFCECFICELNKWVLVNPIDKQIINNYEIPNLKIKNKFGENEEYLMIYRGPDTGKKMSDSEYAQKIKDVCLCNYKEYGM